MENKQMEKSAAKTITITGIPYKIEEVEMIKTSDKIGQIDYLEQVIRIEKTLTDEKKKQVLLHEIIHGILEELGFGELNDNENLVQSIAASLSPIIAFTSS